MLPDVDAFIDRVRLTHWLDENAPQLGSGPLEVGYLHGGTSNVILTLERGGERAVLRRAPLIPPPNSEKAMAREAKVLAALAGTDVPHPRLHAFCDDNAVIGSPFYVMENIDGWAPALHDSGCSYPPAFDTPQAHRAMGFALVEAFARLAKVDPDAVGLADFGQPGSFLGRQVDRWLGQLRSYPDRYPAYHPRDLPGIDTVAAWLRANQPADEGRGIVHGDFGPPNVLFQSALPVQVRAIVDWELATIGDPLLDLALFLVNMRDDQRPEEIPASAYFDTRHYPTRQELIAHYGALTARDMTRIDYYIVLAQFRMACILEYKVAAGAQDGQGVMSIFPNMVLNLMEQARRMVDGQAAKN